MRMLGNAQTVAVIGAALALGAGRRGVDMGPSAIRYAGLDARLEGLGLRVEDWGNVITAVAAGSGEAGEGGAERVGGAVGEGLLPLVLGGDHSVAIGTLGGLAQARGAGGVLWLDA